MGALVREGALNPYQAWLEAVLAEPWAYLHHRLSHANTNLRFLLPYGTESRTLRGLAMTVHGTLLRRKSAVDAVNAGIIASPARRCIGTCIIIVAYRRGGG